MNSKKKASAGLCLLCAALLAVPASAAEAQPQDQTNCIQDVIQFFQQLGPFQPGFATVDGKIHYLAARDVYQQFTPGFVTFEGKLYHVEPDGVTFTPLSGGGFTVVDGQVCYSTDGLSIDTFTPGFVTIQGRLYYVMPDGYSFACHTAGVYSYGNELYCVPADGAEFLTNGVWNGLQFGADGRYTSGNAQLDSLVKQVLAQCTNDSMTREQKLRAAYLYVRDNGRYLARSHYARGSIDWTMNEALFFLQNNRGNCYSFAGAFMYLARQLGYQAYPISGGVGHDNKDHAWVIIPWEDGKTYMFDVELEYAYRYRYSTKRNLNLYKMTTATAPFVYTFPQ